MVLLPPPPTIALANLITLVCRFIACERMYDYPNAKEIATLRQNDNIRNNRVLNSDLNFQPSLKVETKSGVVKGYYMQNVRGQQITAFEGIPFAEPPVGERRFQPPVPKEPWNGTFLANNPGPQCKQLNLGQLLGEENCLNLNVYTKNVNPRKLYPVIIFIHGGFFIASSAQNYGPSYLLADDVIMVAANYRLGPLGFFTTGDDAAPGNAGLRDQALAIEWVFANIERFGGDVSRITLSGNSAGAASAHMHLISNNPIKHKLRNAISMSGSSYNIWSLNRLKRAIKVGKSLATVSGCSGKKDSREMVACLRHVDADILVSNQFLTAQTGLFIPSIEPDVPGAFLSKTPDEAYATGTVARIPLIVTQTSRELNLPLNVIQANLVVSLLRAGYDTTEIARLLTFRREEVDEKLIRKEILKFYTGTDSTMALSQDHFSRIATHRYFSVPLHKVVQMHSQVAPTYASIFNYSSNLGLAGRWGQDPSLFGTLHAEDLVFFLNSTINHPPIARLDYHFAISKLLVNLLGNFAAHGEPFFRTETNEMYKVWEKIENPDKLRYLWIDEEVKMINDPYSKIAKFWESLGIPDITPSFSL